MWDVEYVLILQQENHHRSARILYKYTQAWRATKTRAGQKISIMQHIKYWAYENKSEPFWKCCNAPV